MKYIIDIPDKYVMATNPRRLMICEDTVCIATGIELTPYNEPSQKAIDLQHAHDIENVARMNYSKGAEDAWELSRRIICPSDCCEDSISAYTKEIFNKDGWEIRGIFNDLSYQEAKAKYEAWKKKEEEIRVGDEVIPLYAQYDTMVVTRLWTSEFSDEWVDTIAGDGKIYQFLKTSIKKKGRHFPEVGELLKVLSESMEGSDD